MVVMTSVPADINWLELFDTELPIEQATRWAITPSCGAVVTFLGTVRDHSEGRAGVLHLDYEAYREHVEGRFAAVAEEARRRWPTLGKLAILHRVGRLYVTETSVVVVASAPNRPEAFEAARYAIDTVKQTAPIWKKETWSEGVDWVSCQHSTEVDASSEAAPTRPEVGVG
jgi:molybdopterin synthase catalytic subunit